MKKTTGFGAVLRMEFVKSKNTRSKWAVVLVGLFLPLMYVLGEVISPFIFEPINAPKQIVTDMFIAVSGIFSKFILPLGIVGLCTSITSVDYKMNGLQLMETQPITKWNIYFAKFTLLLIQIVATILTLIISTIIIAFVLKFVKQPDANMYLYSIDLGFMLHSGLNIFLNSIAFAALLFAISANVSKSILINILGSGLVIGYMIAVSLINVPYYVPMRIMDVGSSSLSNTGKFITTFNWSSILFGAFYALQCFLLYKYRNYKRNYFKQRKVVLANIGLSIVILSASFWMLQPTQIPAYGKTVIAGSFNSEAQIKNVIVLDENNTLVAEIPVVNDSFSVVIPDANIILGNYKLVTNTKILCSNFFLAPQDSVFVAAKFDGNVFLSSQTTGTRLVENIVERRKTSGYMRYLEDLSADIKDGVTPKHFEEVMKDAESGAHKLSNNIRTADNFTVRDDYKALSAKSIDVQLLKLWDDFVKAYEFAHPDLLGKTQDSEYIIALRELVSLDDEALINVPLYMDYVKARVYKNAPLNDYGLVLKA